MNADDETFLLLQAYADGELSPGEALAMERRLAGEPDLRRLADQLRALSGSLRETLGSVPVPPDLHARATAAAGIRDEAPRRRWESLWQPLREPFWQPLAAALLVGLVVGGLIGSGAIYLGFEPAAIDPGEIVLAAHLRGLAAPQPFDIASSNRHVVKPWFNGRTTIAPGAPDLADVGFPLAGGRIDIIGEKPVPTLVYRHDQHVISVTIEPRVTARPPGEQHLGGSTIEWWDAGDLTYAAVSDLNPRDLRSFVEQFRARLAKEG